MRLVITMAFLLVKIRAVSIECNSEPWKSVCLDYNVRYDQVYIETRFGGRPKIFALIKFILKRDVVGDLRLVKV